MKIIQLFKLFILALCIGMAVALIFDSLRPEYKYYDQYQGTVITKEVYNEMAKRRNERLVKYKQFNLIALLLGIATTVSVIIINPLNYSKEPISHSDIFHKATGQAELPGSDKQSIADKLDVLKKVKISKENSNKIAVENSDKTNTQQGGFIFPPFNNPLAKLISEIEDFKTDPEITDEDIRSFYRDLDTYTEEEVNDAIDSVNSGSQPGRKT